MTNTHTQQTQVNHIDTDYKAESILAHLISQGLDAAQIVFKRLGASQRGVAKDIGSVKQLVQEKGNNKLEIGTNRDGIYDKLPEGLFYKTNHKAKSSTNDILEEIARNRQEEFYNRRFFQPLEEEIDKSNLFAHAKELCFDQKNSHSEYSKVFEKFWPLIKNMDKRRAAIFISIIPLVHQLRNNNDKIAEALGLVLEVPVTVRAYYGEQDIQSSLYFSLGNSKLGKNFTTEGALNDRYKNIKIKIGPLKTEEYQRFYRGGSESEILNELIRLLFPANCLVLTEFDIKQEENNFQLNNSGHSTCLLGVNTAI